jgi:hypothetical protein
MNCGEFRRLIPDLARGGEVQQALRGSAWHHQSGCPVCARLLEAEKELSAGFSRLSEAMSRESAGRDVELCLLAAVPAPAAVLPMRRSPVRRWVWAGLAAAAILVAVSGAVRFDFQRNGGSPAQVEIAAVQPEVPPAPVERPPEPASGLKPGTRSRTVASAPARAMAPQRDEANVGAAEQDDSDGEEVVIGTDFMALSGCVDADCLEDSFLVRVELPRMALSHFGHTVKPHAATDRISADVLVGHDGVARAVRFIQPLR